MILINRKSLPLGDPLITGYQYRAFPLSVISTNDDYLPWFLNNHIQIRCNANIDSNKSLEFDFIDANCLYYPSPFLSVERVSRSMIDGKHISPIDFILESIEQGYYSHLFVDEFFIPERVPYQQQHVLHDILLYGYDLVEDTLNAIGFDQEGIYRPITISFEQFKQAYKQADSYQSHMVYVHLLKLSNKPDYYYDLSLTVDLLKDYINPPESPNYLKALDNKTKNHFYGMQIYEGLNQYLNLIEQGHVHAETRSFQLLLEHKKIMFMRIRYLKDQGILTNHVELFENTYIELQKKVLVIRNAMIKFQITGKSSYLTKIRETLTMIFEVESHILRKLLFELER